MNEEVSRMRGIPSFISTWLFACFLQFLFGKTDSFLSGILTYTVSRFQRRCGAICRGAPCGRIIRALKAGRS